MLWKGSTDPMDSRNSSNSSTDPKSRLPSGKNSHQLSKIYRKSIHVIHCSEVNMANHRFNQLETAIFNRFSMGFLLRLHLPPSDVTISKADITVLKALRRLGPLEAPRGAWSLGDPVGGCHGAFQLQSFSKVGNLQ